MTNLKPYYLSNGKFIYQLYRPLTTLFLYFPLQIPFFMFFNSYSPFYALVTIRVYCQWSYTAQYVPIDGQLIILE